MAHQRQAVVSSSFPVYLVESEIVENICITGKSDLDSHRAARCVLGEDSRILVHAPSSSGALFQALNA